MTTFDRHPDAENRPARATWAAGVGTALAVVAVLSAGVFGWGRLATTETIAMALTVGWFAAVLLIGGVAARRRRDLAVPLAVGYGLSALAAVVLLGLPQLRDTTVDERVATAEAPTDAGVAAVAAPTDATGGGNAGSDGERDSDDIPAGDPGDAEPDGQRDDSDDTPAGAGSDTGSDGERDRRPPRRNSEVATGSFVDLAHPGEGRATVIDLADGGRVLTLTDFVTDAGPDLRVYLTEQDPTAGGGIGEFVDLGALKGNVGDQQYGIPEDVDLDALSNAVVWCRAFAVGFTAAPLAG
jgi:hypothetical protein